MKRVVYILSFFLFFSGVYSQERSMADTIEVEIHAKVNDLLSQMTLEEKIGQLTLYTARYGDDGPYLERKHRQYIEQGKVGGIFNAVTAEFTFKLQKIAIEKSRLKIPLMFGFDVIHGFKTIFPIPLGEAASWDLEAIQKSARIASTEATAAGLHWTFAPMVDIARDPRWGRIAEGSGEDPYIGSLIARARVRGFQGENLGADNTLLACAKHFAAYGAAEGGRDYNTVDVSERTLREIYLPPFQACVEEGVCTVMTSFNELSGVPSSANKRLLSHILRGEWKFGGFVVSDYTSINEMIQHGIAATPEDAAYLALDAGLDMDMQGEIFHNELAGLVEKKVISEQMIDEAARRILTMKFKLGLFDTPYAYSNIERQRQRIMTQEHLDAALDMAKKSIVLLKNAEKTLPLSKDVHKLALIGPLADNQRDILGSWCGAGNYRDAVTLLEGIRRRVSPQTTLLYAKGCDINGESQEGFAEAITLAQQADVIIVALGEEAGMSGEAASRSSIDLPGVQEKLLEEIHKTGKKIILVLMNGRPLIIDWADQNLHAILECWFLGTQGGNAIAAVIFGEHNPSGKLPVTFPRCVGQIPIYYNHKNTGRPISAEKYTSKYLDIENSPLYCFGYGLSYTVFEYENLQLSQLLIKKGTNIEIFVDVKNTGDREGTEVVQLYLRDEVGTVTRPVKELKGFERISLKPGEKKTVRFELTPKHLSFYNREMKFTVEEGFFQVMVGSNSQKFLSSRFEVR